MTAAAGVALTGDVVVGQRDQPGDGPSRAWWSVGFAMLVMAWGGNQFTPLLLVYRERVGLSQLAVDVLLGAYVLGLAPSLLVGAGLSDRFGRRPLMLAGLASALVGSVLLALGERGATSLLFAGRVLSGVAVATAMSVGTTWITELSRAPYARTSTGAGARRSAVLLTAGFAAGPASAGVLAQWTPQPLLWPYVVHLALCLPAVLLVARHSCETRPRRHGSSRVRARVPLPSLGRRRFLHVVVPMAPWIFGSAGVAYAIIPQVVDGSLGEWALLYTAGITVATLLTGVAVQPLARRLDDRSTARAVVVSMALMSTGMALAAVTAHLASPWLALPVAVLLGAAYGIAVVSGLLEVQRLARPERLAELTGVYYALAYVGFTVPAALAFLHRWAGFPTMLTVVAMLSLACTCVCWSGWSRHLPPTTGPRPVTAETRGPRRTA